MWSAIRELKLKDCSFSSFFNGYVTEVFDLDYRLISDGLYNELPRCVTVLGSINGLICLVDERSNIFLWNPSNRKYKKLPNPSRPTVWFEKSRMYGFGYDEVHDDYKLVGTFCHCGKFGQGELMIYSLKSDSWGSVDDCKVRKCKSRDEVGVSGMFVNGKLHWANDSFDGLIINHKDWRIMSFDLANEKWGEVEHPCYKKGYIALLLGVLGSDLSVFCDKAGSHVDFWVMKEYGIKESWKKMFTVNYPFNSLGYDFFLPSFISNKGEILVRFAKTSLIYNPKNVTFRYSHIIDFYDIPEVAIYVESLVCPFSKEGAADATKHKRLKKLRSSKPSTKTVK